METVKKFVEIIAVLVVILFLWFAYSLIRFDGFFHPLYTLGLSDPYEYYQRYMGSKLVSVGEEYNIQDIDTSDWYTYRDTEKKFEFKHPYAHTEDIRYEETDTKRVQLQLGIQAYDNCDIYISFNERGVGTRWLPRIKQRVEFLVRQNRKSELHFIRDQYGGGLQIRSTRFNNGEPGDIQFTGATFIRQDDDQFVHLVDHDNTCDEAVMKGMLATFRFVE